MASLKFMLFQKKYKSELKGFTLIETLIAMVILITVFGITMLTFEQVSRSNTSLSQIKLITAMDSLSAATHINGSDDKEVFYENYVVRQSVSSYPNSPEEFWLLSLVVRPKNGTQIIYTKNILIPKQ